MILAPEQLPLMQRKGLVLVGGAFDPLHPGHLAYLSLARDYGGPVLCAVANDATVAKKHPPLLSDHDRAAILDRFVEYVTIPDAGGMPVVLSRLQPKAYLKGDDWEGRLPADEVEVCHRIGIPVVYTHLRTHSSSLILADYQRRLEAAALERFQAFVAAQRQPEPWVPVTIYNLETRRQIEGQHPDLVKSVFQPTFVVDAGCGPDGLFVQLLRERGLHACGFDLQVNTGFGDVGFGDLTQMETLAPRMGDLVICREVLEHLTVPHLMRAVANLVRLSTKFVYLTTRFHPCPTHLLDATTEFETDPSHITCLTKEFLVALFLAHGCRRRADLEAQMDWQAKGRCVVMEVPDAR